jgi:hypothetical protein
VLRRVAQPRTTKQAYCNCMSHLKHTHICLLCTSYVILLVDESNESGSGGVLGTFSTCCCAAVLPDARVRRRSCRGRVVVNGVGLESQ